MRFIIIIVGIIIISISVTIGVISYHPTTYHSSYVSETRHSYKPDENCNIKEVLDATNEMCSGMNNYR